MVRLLVVVLIVILVALQFQLWQQYGEVRDLRRLVEAQVEQNAVLHKRNNELAAEVKDLRAGEDAIEERARTELGLIGEDEQFIQIIDPPDEGGLPSDGNTQSFGDNNG